MKLKIISDGTNTGTKLIDEDTGEMVHLIQKLTWEADASDFSTKITVELLNVPVEIITKTEVDLLEFMDNETSWDPVHTKTFEKEIKIISQAPKGQGFTPHTIIKDAQTNEQIAGIQKITWEATPEKISAKIKKIKFDKKDW